MGLTLVRPWSDRAEIAKPGKDRARIFRRFSPARRAEPITHMPTPWPDPWPLKRARPILLAQIERGALDMLPAEGPPHRHAQIPARDLTRPETVQLQPRDAPLDAFRAAILTSRSSPRNPTPAARTLQVRLVQLRRPSRRSLDTHRRPSPAVRRILGAGPDVGRPPSVRRTTQSSRPTPARRHAAAHGRPSPAPRASVAATAGRST